MSSTLRQTALADLDGLRHRHPDVFRTPYGLRALQIGVVTLLLGLALYGFWRLEFSFGRLGAGLGQIAHIVGMMFPPSPGTKLPLFLNALAETLAIALLGTLTAALLAFPVGFLAAKNVVPNVFRISRCVVFSMPSVASTC
jgi:phosphonate transport system permease protein